MSRLVQPPWADHETISLLEECAGKIFSECPNPAVEELSRVGKSGAKVFLIFPYENKSGHPRVVKIGTHKDIDEESQGLKIAGQVFDDIDAIPADPIKREKKGAIIYSYQGDKEFEETAFDLESNTTEECLAKVFDKILPAHLNGIERRLDIGPDYDAYFRNHISKDCIQSMLGIGNSQKFVKMHGIRECPNPLIVLEKLMEYPLQCRCGIVHGDLHPRNVLFQSPLQPHLIDWKWCKQDKHVMVDYVLFENSLRFMILPQVLKVNLDEQLLVDRSLLSMNGFKRIGGHQFFPESKRALYSRLGKLIGIIRQCAMRSINQQKWFTSYLLSQFIVLYGTIRYDDYDQYIALRALCLIGKRLAQTLNLEFG